MVSIFKSMTVRILVCLEFSLFLTSIVAGDPAYHKRYCGRVLTESLALICEGEYETIIPMEYQKRSDESFDEYANNDQAAALMEDLPIQYQTYAYLSKLLPESVAMRPRARRDWMVIRHGVYDECCRKACSFQELKSYCKRKN